MNPSVLIEEEQAAASTVCVDAKKKRATRVGDRLLIAVAVVLCILCCSLFLSIPTESISVDTVYQGF